MRRFAAGCGGLVNDGTVMAPDGAPDGTRRRPDGHVIAFRVSRMCAPCCCQATKCSSVTSEAEGAAAGHAHAAREAAARKLIGNHENVLRDVCNPSSALNIEGKALTQRELQRVDVGSAMYADAALWEVARRLLGKRPGLDGHARVDGRNAAECDAWAAAARYLDGRIQSTDDEKPGRTPDLPPAAAAAMRAVLAEVGCSGATAVLVAAECHWVLLRAALQTALRAEGVLPHADKTLGEVVGHALSELGEYDKAHWLLLGEQHRRIDAVRLVMEERDAIVHRVASLRLQARPADADRR